MKLYISVEPNPRVVTPFAAPGFPAVNPAGQPRRQRSPLGQAAIQGDRA